MLLGKQSHLRRAQKSVVFRWLSWLLGIGKVGAFGGLFGCLQVCSRVFPGEALKRQPSLSLEPGECSCSVLYFAWVLALRIYIYPARCCLEVVSLLWLYLWFRFSKSFSGPSSVSLYNKRKKNSNLGLYLIRRARQLSKPIGFLMTILVIFFIASCSVACFISSAVPERKEEIKIE